MIVGLDIDGVVADFISPFLREAEKLMGNVPIPAYTITDLSFKQHPFLSERIVSECMKAVSYDPDFWRDLSPLLSPGEWVFNDVADGNVVCQTCWTLAPPGTSENGFTHKRTSEFEPTSG